MTMALYAGPPIDAGPISLVAPEEERLRPLLAEADLPDHEKGWLAHASGDSGSLYFCVSLHGRPVGQIMLHDMELAQHQSLVGYHIFAQADRRLGFGSAALRAVCRHAYGELGMQRIVAITSLDNHASRRTAEKAGFREAGPAREGPHLIAYEWLASDVIIPS